MRQLLRSIEWISCCVLSGLTACSEMGERPFTYTDPDRPVLASDWLFVTVADHEGLSGHFQVSRDGTADFPLIGSIRVAGLTGDRVAQVFGDALEESGYLSDPLVSVSIWNPASHEPPSMLVLGSVDTPGPYPIPDRGTTLRDVLALAGGATLHGELEAPQVLRSGEPLVLDCPFGGVVPTRCRLEDFVDTIILPGDVVEMPERFF